MSGRYAGDEPLRLSDALAAVGAELGLPATNVYAELDTHWNDIVGADVAAHARLVSVRDGVLTVAVDDPVWATQLRYLETAVVERATAFAGAGAVTAMRLRVG